MTATQMEPSVQDANSTIHNKPAMSSSNILVMNMGFFGVQFSFGLTQTAITPLFTALGADGHSLPILNLAGPMTGLLIQPLIGAASDRTWSDRWGRRKLYILAGALLCIFTLIVFPFVSVLWLAVVCYWLLDIGNNTSMEPYRAFISDRLPKNQLARGFLVQSMFTGAGAVLSNFSIFAFQRWLPGLAGNGVPYWVYVCFFIGVVCIGFTVFTAMARTTELRPPQHELDEIAATKGGPVTFVRDLVSAVRTMPIAMHKIGFVFVFQWYAMFIYWQFVALSVGESVFGVTDTHDPAFQQAAGWSGLMNGSYNLVTMLVALIMLPIVVKFGGRIVHAASLAIGGLSLMWLSTVTNQWMALVAMVGLGIFWASAVGVPYLMVASMVPNRKSGVYMGILNMMIVIPMLVETMTFGWIYQNLLGNKATNALLLAGALFLIGAVAMLWVKPPSDTDESEIVPLGAPDRGVSVYDRVIVGSDGTDNSLFGVHRAMAIARDAGAKLTIVTAYDPDEFGVDGVRAHLHGTEAGRLALERTVDDLNRHRVTSYDSLLIAGDPAQALLTAADGNSKNLIVVGNRGMGADRGQLLGTVPSTVVRHAAGDVIVVQIDLADDHSLSRR
ncbi:MAG: MFS transporter [Actinomycetales bacterium]